MTDRAHSVTIVFENNIRVDDIQAYIDALYLMKGVIAVQANVSDATEFVAESRAKFELQQKIFNAFRSDK